MGKVKSGFAFHVHHDKLVEFCTDYDERVAYIKSDKPKHEQELRLRLFQLIPEDRLPIPLIEAWKAYDEALKAYDEAGGAYDEALKAYDKAWKAYDKALKAYDKALKACDETWKACEPELMKLHEELCLGCPWNGETIFS